MTSVLPTDVQADHNYIREIREYGDHTIKIGLPAANFDQCDEWDTPFIVDDPDDTEVGAEPLEEDCACDYPIWNDDMATKFTKTLNIGSTPYIKFDAVILHNYLVAGNVHAGCPDNTNWQRIAANAAFTDDAPYEDAWTYSPSPDIYLSPIYEGLAGIPVELDGDVDPVIQDGNFKDFVKTDLKTAYDIHGTHLFYTDEYESSESKELWFTELNLLNKAKGATDDFDQDFVNMVPNSFVHAVVLENWLLWYVKEYFDTDYNPGVFKYATFQSFLGGNAIDYMSPSSKNDQIKLNIPDPDLVCSDEEWDNDFYVRRATYYLMQLMNEIPFHNLEYARSSIGLYTNNYNLPPSTFTELDEEGDVINIYVFYTNIKSTTQKYVFDPGDLHEAIFEATSVSLGAATIHALDPTDLFSTAGRSGVYGNAEPDPADDPINIHYNCDEGYGSNKYPFEIVGISTSTSSTSCPGGYTPPTGGICVTVPATSAGYFVIPVTAYRLGEVKDVYAIYPNPASTNFVIHQIDPHHSIIKNMSVEIYNMYGGLIQTTTVDEGQAINISQLPVGIYTVIIKTEGLKTESESLIKMK